MNWRSVFTDPFSGIALVADAAKRGAARFSHLSAVPVVAVVKCRDVMQLHRAVLITSH
jgi:hypothetical protein